jgi:hypothetical protein
MEAAKSQRQSQIEGKKAGADQEFSTDNETFDLKNYISEPSTRHFASAALFSDLLSHHHKTVAPPSIPVTACDIPRPKDVHRSLASVSLLPRA